MAVKIQLRELREQKGLSQNALARQLGMSLNNIQKIEYNKARSIPLDTLEKLCLALDCEIGDLLVLVRESSQQTNQESK